MKKILVISQGFWPEIFPINTIVNELSKSNFEIDVLTGYPNYPKGNFFSGYNSYKTSITKKLNYRIIRVPIISRGTNSKFRILLNYLSFILSSIFIGGFTLRKKKYDIILVYATSPIFQSYIGVFFKFIKKAKLITWVQDLWPNILKDTDMIKNNFILSFLKFFVKHVYNCNDLLLAQSLSFQKEIKKITKTQVNVLYNPAYSEKKIFKSKFKKKINILYAGNIGNAQPWETLLDFLNSKEFNMINLTICGEGQKFNYVKKFIMKNNIKNISVCGFLKGKKLEDQYKKNNFFLIMLKAGKDLNKTIPSKFQNYLFHNKPILALSDGEVYKFVKNFYLGFASKSENIKQYVEMFHKIKLLKQEQYKKITNNTQKFYLKNFSQKIINIKLINEINKI